MALAAPRILISNGESKFFFQYLTSRISHKN